MSTISCPKCGTNNLASARYCTTCGTPLAAPPPPAQTSYQPPQQQWYPSGQPQAQPYYSYPANYWDTQRQSRIDNTKTGLLLLMIGSLLSWIPFVGFVGGLVALIGAIFIIIGREGFGQAHARNVIASIIIFVVGLGVLAVGFLLVFITAFSNAISNPGSVSLQPTGYTIVLLTGGAILGVSEVLFTYALQNSTGRALLWAAYIIGLAIGILNDFILLPLLTGNGGLSISSPAFLLSGVLAAPGSILYGVAFYMARERIQRREIPTTATQSGVPPSSSLH